MRKFFIALLGLLAFLPMTFGAYLMNVPQTRVQPDGDTLHCFATGDEYFHRLHDANGYTIVLDRATGYYVYADKVGDALVPTRYIAGRTNPAEVGLVPNLSISAEQWRLRRTQMEAFQPAGSGMRATGSNHGHINNIVVFIRFADDDPFTNSFNDVNRMFNDSTPGYSSMYNFFKSASYGQLAITSTFYPAPSGSNILSYQDTYNRSYYQPQSYYNQNGYDPDNVYERVQREHELLARAVNYIANMVPTDLNFDYNNDRSVDNIVFVVRGDVGDWSDLLWPHRSSLAYTDPVYINGLRVWDYNFQLADNETYFTTGVLCHEMNHSLGAPDLYHYNEGTEYLSPVYNWDLMGLEFGTPQHMGAYMKYKYGKWIDEIPEITECGTYSLRSLGSSSTNNCYRIASPNPDEFFVLEYRNNDDLFEGTLPDQTGLLVYRINTNFSGNANYNGVDVFDEVYVYRPYGTTTEDGNIWNAAFSANAGRTAMNANTNPQPFLTDGTVLDMGTFTIRNVTEEGGDSISFTFCKEGYLQVVPDSVVLAADSGATGSLRIISDSSWSVSGECSWLTYTPSADSVTVCVVVAALSENATFENRSCVLTVTASNGTQKTVSVVQLGQETILEAVITNPVSGTTGVLDHVNSTCNIEITANVPWSISADAEWVGFSQAEGEGTASITAIALTENPTCMPRYATLSVVNGYGQHVELQVMQSNTTNGSLSVTPTAFTIGNYVNSTAQLTLSATDAWSVLSKPIWLSVTPEEGSSSDQQLTLTVTETNSSTSSRTGTVIISDICGRANSQVQIVVTQPAGYLSLSVPSVTLGTTQGSTATAEVQCSGSWNAVTSTVPEWLSVSPMTGVGNTTLTLRALSSNSESTERTAVVRFRYTLNFSAELLVTQQPVTGIVEISEVSMLLYPNPVNDLLTVAWDGTCQYTVYDATGRAAFSGNLSDGENTISVSGLENGIYFIRFCDKMTGKVAVAKVVKQ